MTDEEINKDFNAWWKENGDFYGERDRALIYRGYVNGRKHVPPAPQIHSPAMTREEIEKNFEAWWAEYYDPAPSYNKSFAWIGYQAGHRHAGSAPASEIKNGPIGWICPKCGAGNAPFSSRCGCTG